MPAAFCCSGLTYVFQAINFARPQLPVFHCVISPLLRCRGQAVLLTSVIHDDFCATRDIIINPLGILDGQTHTAVGHRHAEPSVHDTGL